MSRSGPQGLALPSQEFDTEAHQRMCLEVPEKFRTGWYDLTDPDLGRVFVNTGLVQPLHVDVALLPPVLGEEIC